MNIKILIGIIIIVVIGVVLLGSNKKSNSGTETQTQQQASPTTQPSVSESTDKKMQEGAVEITSSGFLPSTITIKAGTKVVWTNKSGDTATVNSDLHPIHSVYPPLNLNQVTDNGSMSLVFDKPGTYKYHDHLNPGRTGAVVVE